MIEGAPLLRADPRSLRFEAIFRTTHASVLAYALRRTAGREEAEDAVSETYLVAWRRLDAVPEAPLPWLLGTARKVIANQHRAKRRRDAVGPRVALDLVAPTDPKAATEERVAERESFAQAFTALPARDREVLTLITWDGLAPREAARVMGCSAATFSLRLFRARRRLMKELAASGHSLGEETEGTRPGERDE